MLFAVRGIVRLASTVEVGEVGLGVSKLCKVLSLVGNPLLVTTFATF